MISQLIPECKKAFKEIMDREGLEESISKVDLKLDSRYFLTERDVTSGKRVAKSDESSICFGGVIMTNEDGLIVCKNTLDTRLELAYQHLLPSIRKSLYDE